MKPHLVAFAVGLLVGAIYGLLNVRSPAPPVVALVGLLGILLGEQIVPLARTLFGGDPPSPTSLRHDIGHHVFGSLPHRRRPQPAPSVRAERPPGGPRA